MAYVTVGPKRTWVVPSHMTVCPQIVQVSSSDTPYVAMDFSRQLVPSEAAILSAGTATEVNGKTIVFTDESADPNNTTVSLKVSGMAKGDYLVRVPITLSDGTDNVVSAQGRLRVI